MRTRFEKAELSESSERLQNPGCGWYHIYTFSALPPADGRSVGEEVWLDEACRQERLALALVDIGKFRSHELSEEALGHLEQILRFFRKERKLVILRCAYDIRGDGMVREPSERSLVKRHLEQIGKVCRSYAEDILVIQGLLVGSWGEMHGSRHLDPASIRELADTLYRAVDGRCALSVRTPAQWRQAAGQERVSGLRPMGSRETDPPARPRIMGLYNDGIFGSPTDMGTYNGAEKEKELAWQERQLAAAPNGGEVLRGTPPVGYLQADRIFQRMHLTYLNSIWQKEQLDIWKGQRVEGRGCWDGATGYDYIGAHLGYRFVVRAVRTRAGGRIEITVENCGYADLLLEADCYLILEKEGQETVRRKIPVDAGSWKCNKKTRFLAGLPGRTVQTGRAFLYLRLERRSDGSVIRFANRDAGEQVLLGELRK